MTPTFEEICKTFGDAAYSAHKWDGIPTLAQAMYRDGLLAVLDKHVRVLIANAHEDGVRAGRSDVMMSNHHDYAAAKISAIRAALEE